MPHERDTPKGVSKPRGMPVSPLLSRIPRDSLPNLNVDRYRGITRWDAEQVKDGLEELRRILARTHGRRRERKREREERPLRYGDILRARRVSCLRNRGSKRAKDEKQGVPVPKGLSNTRPIGDGNAIFATPLG